MQKIILLFTLLIWGFCFSQSINYYYYNGSPIYLKEREDAIAVVLNSTASADVVNQLKSRLSSSDTLKNIGKGVLYIKLSEHNPSLYIGRFTGISGIKFITRVYRGDSPSFKAIAADEFIVRLRNREDKNKLDFINIQKGCYIIGNVNDENGFLLKSLDGIAKDALEFCEEYRRSGIFEYCEPNFIYPDYCLLNFDPNDPFYPSQWALKNTGQLVPTGGLNVAGDDLNVNGIPGADMGVHQAWDHVTGSSSVVIAIIDTGIDSTHPDLRPNISMAGYDAYWNRYGVPRDTNGHGTACAGIAAAVFNNSTGVAGVAPGCKIMAIKIFNASGTSDLIALIRAFDTARVKGVQVLSNSWHTFPPSSSLDAAINNAATSGRGGLGCVILFAAGNDGLNPPNYPSVLSNVISVGASTTHDQKKAPGTGNQFWWGGNYGEATGWGDLDCVAPTICYTTDIQGLPGYSTTDYTPTFNGTSCSCPNAAGVAALILSVNTSFTRLQVTEHLLRGADKIDNVPYSKTKTYGRWNDYFGYGRVNAYNSVRLAAGVDVTPPTINHLNRASHNSTYPTLITAEIIDHNGTSVPTTGSNRPRIIYRVNKNNSGWSSWDSAYFLSNSGNNFTFQIPCQGWETQVQYYIRAYDNSGNQTTFPRGAPNPFWLCFYAIGSLTEVTDRLTNWSPPDGNYGVSPSINFGNFIILNTKVRIYLRHTYLSDNILFIWSPITDTNNNRKCLFSRNGGSSANITGTTVSDSATLFWWQGTPPYLNGHFLPDYTMRGYNGTNANGNWRFLNFDVATPDAPTYDSIRITFLRTSGTLSPAARLNIPQDSVINFGVVPNGGFVDKNFYLKNVGTSNLTVSSVNFTGTYASQFSLLTPLPSPIAPGDSGLFTVRASNPPSPLEPEQEYGIFSVERAVMNINNNDPSKPVFKVSLQSDNPLPVSLSSFNLNTQGRNVLLFWTTDWEMNNKGFEIQRTKLDQNGMTTTWDVIGFVNGNGTVSEPKTYSFTDIKLNHGKYKYRLKQSDFNGNFEYFQNSDIADITKPSEFSLSQNFPNPANPVSVIDFQLPVHADVNISVYDLTGRLLITLVNGRLEAGYHSVKFDGGNYASGIYIYRMNVSQPLSFSSVRKLVLIK
ncbi:MAG: S8 family serine peptidase [Ignavibacteria bacterium]|nr:S8 family serine peptidase [Ignavibacteria bacterium]